MYFSSGQTYSTFCVCPLGPEVGSQHFTGGSMISAMFLIGATAYAASNFNPKILHKVVDEVEIATRHDERPVIIFDLDDTLVDSKTRTLRILKDFAALEEIRARFPRSAAIAQQATLADMGYYLDKALKKLGVSEDEFVGAAMAFWTAKFFSNEYCGSDLPEPGAASYARKLHKTGAKIIYLTGRDRPRMEACTKANLLKRHFPVGEGVALMMKPDKDIDDVEFKVKAFEKIKDAGKIVAGFENEPRNINEMQKAFPKGIMVFVDTMHSSRPDVPNDSIHWIKDFRP